MITRHLTNITVVATLALSWLVGCNPNQVTTSNTEAIGSGTDSSAASTSEQRQQAFARRHAADGSKFVSKSHAGWSGVADGDLIAMDIGNDAGLGVTAGDHVYTWSIPDMPGYTDNKHGTVCKGSSTTLCPSGSKYSFVSPVSKYEIQAIAIAKDTQKVYTWYTEWDPNWHGPGSGDYVTTRVIGTTDNLSAYDDGHLASSKFAGFFPGELLDAGISTNGEVYYYYSDQGPTYRAVGTSVSPCAYACDDIVTSVRDGVGDRINGIAFNAAGTEYTWYIANPNPGGSNSDDLNTGSNSLILW